MTSHFSNLYAWKEGRCAKSRKGASFDGCLLRVWGHIENALLNSPRQSAFLSAHKRNSEGLFEKIEDRLAAAKEMWKDCNGDNCDNLFKMDIAPGCEPQIFPFLDGELSEDSEEDKKE